MNIESKKYIRIIDGNITTCIQVCNIESITKIKKEQQGNSTYSDRYIIRMINNKIYKLSDLDYTTWSEILFCN